MRSLLATLILCLVAAPAIAAAPTNYYVDPAAGNDATGDGTVGTPWKTTQHALDTITRNATNGDQINVKAGQADVLVASLSLATYGAPTPMAPLRLSGYTAIADDGGIGNLDGNGVDSIYDGTNGSIKFTDFKLGNCGTNPVFKATGQYCDVVDCEVYGDTSVANYAIDFAGASCCVVGCNLHTIAGFGVKVGSDSVVGNNYISAERLGVYCGTLSVVSNNVITLNYQAYAIQTTGTVYIAHNSILNAGGGNSYGMLCGGGVILNNLIEGYPDGHAIRALSNDLALCSGNAAFNCGTVVGVEGLAFDNEALASTPFAKSGDNTFANRFTYFAPLDVGNVWAGAYPAGSGVDKGAVQHVPAASGGGGGYIIGASLQGNATFELTSRTVSD